MKTFQNFTEAYVSLLNDVYYRPEFECAPRGMKIKETLASQFCICNPRDRIPYVEGRNFSLQYMIAELVWYITSNNSTKWISNYSSFWKKITDDGKTANSAYGSRIFVPHDRIASSVDKTWTQWEFVINELVKDNDSRRAVIQIRSAHDAVLASLDVPCTLTMQFFIRNDKLHMVVSMRSSDLILGLAYDIPAFTMFQEMMAIELSERLERPIQLGNYYHTSNSLHIYERHFDMVFQIISNNSNWKRIERPMPEIDCSTNWSMFDNIKGIANWESQIRSAENTEKLQEITKRLQTFELTPNYWMDWIKILASHRAKKLGDSEYARKLVQDTSFEGYHFFA